MGYETFERLCKEKGVTPYRVAKDTGVTTATLSSWKSGRYTPKADKLQKLADYFGVGVEVFFDDAVQTNEQGTQYYEDVRSALLAQQMFDDPQLHALFHVKKNIDPQRFQAFYDMVIALYKSEHPDDDYDFNGGESSD